MPLRDSTGNWGAVTRFFHWVTAVLILVMLGLGLVMVRMDYSPFQFELYALHKSLGFLILAVTVPRLVWRLVNARPPLPGARVERIAARATHWLLYFLLLLLPLSGWMFSSASNFPVSVFGLFTLPDFVATDESLAHFLEKVHEIAAWTLIGLLGLHIAGTLKHHLLDRDDTLRRMVPAFRLYAPGLALLAAICFLPLFLSRPPVSGQADVNFDSGFPSKKEMAAETGPVQAPLWVVDYERSRLGFEAVMENAAFEGQFADFTAEIRFDPGNLSGSSVVVEIPVSSVTTGQEMRDRQLLTGDWFNIADYPYARFEATRFRHLGEKEYVASGYLEIRGISREIDLPFSLNIVSLPDGRSALAQGDVRILRRAFGIGQGQWQDADVVKDEVRVVFNIAAFTSPLP